MISEQLSVPRGGEGHSLHRHLCPPPSRNRSLPFTAKAAAASRWRDHRAGLPAAAVHPRVRPSLTFAHSLYRARSHRFRFWHTNSTFSKTTFSSKGDSERLAVNLHGTYFFFLLFSGHGARKEENSERKSHLYARRPPPPQMILASFTTFIFVSRLRCMETHT